MTDRELLELAAKAAGIELKWHHSHNDAYARRNGEYWAVWNPLTNDGDALRLAVVLQMELKVYEVSAHAASAIGGCSVCTSEKGDPYAATRRAIVRAAAEIGRNMT
jgi:hypothetical protein